MNTLFIVAPLFIGTTELLLIGGMALLLFGGKKLPEMMRGLGQGVKEFKRGMEAPPQPSPMGREDRAAEEDSEASGVGKETKPGTEAKTETKTGMAKETGSGNAERQA